MSLSCGYGVRLENSTKCQCDHPHMQSLDMWVYTDIPCTEDDFKSCLPCDVNGDLYKHLYFAAGIMGLTTAVIVVLTLLFQKKRVLHAGVVTCLLFCTLADVFQATGYTSGIGSDVWITSLFFLIVWLISLCAVLDHRRHLKYILRTIALTRGSVWNKRVKPVIYLNNFVPAAALMLSAITITALALEVQNKTMYMRIYMLGMVVLLLYLILLTIIVYKKPLEDIAELQKSCKLADATLNKARKRIQDLRIGHVLILIPLVVPFLFSFFFDAWYRCMLYLIPILQYVQFIAISLAFVVEAIRKQTRAKRRVKEDPSKSITSLTSSSAQQARRMGSYTL